MKVDYVAMIFIQLNKTSNIVPSVTLTVWHTQNRSKYEGKLLLHTRKHLYRPVSCKRGYIIFDT